MTLALNHTEQLRKSAISDAIITERGYSSIITLNELAQQDGQLADYQRRLPALGIPVYRLGERYALIIRPDTPRTPKQDSKLHTIKYEWPEGVPLCFDVLPCYRTELTEATSPIWFTEGAKKADALASLGEDLIPISLNGVWGWRSKDATGKSQPLPDFAQIPWLHRAVYLCFDSDYTTNQSVRHALDKLAETLTTRNAHVFIVTLPAAADGRKQGADDVLANGWAYADLLEAAVPYRQVAADLASPKFAALLAVPHDDPRPLIDRTTIDLPALVKQAWDAIHAQNDPPTLFRRAGELVRLERSETETLTVRTVDERRMTGILARTGRWVRISHTKNGPLSTDTAPPASIVDDCLVNPDSRIPALTRVVYAPLLADGDVLLTEPGYHPAARVYYDPKHDTVIPSVAAQPTHADMIQARTWVLEDLLADFPFVSDADRAHAVALFMLPFVRDLIDGPTPLHLIEAPTMGSGKGLLAETLLMPALGEPPSAMTEATTDEEWGKLITSNLLATPTVIYIDNLNRKLASGKLAAALTAREYSDRVLGKSEQVNLPVRCVWAATANNPLLSTEIARRCIRIRIDPRTDEPWMRAVFKHPNLRTWVEQNRGQLIWAALTMARYGLAHGSAGRALGSYEAWSDVIGRILNGCGIPDFLGNLDLLYARADAEGSAWRALIDAWWQKHQSQAQPAGELFPLIAEAGADDLVNGKDEIGRKKSFGKALARVVDRVFSIDLEGTTRRLQITEGGIRHKAKLWRLVPLEVGVLGVLGVCSSPPAQEIHCFPVSLERNPPNTHNTPGDELVPPGPLKQHVGLQMAMIEYQVGGTSAVKRWLMTTGRAEWDVDAVVNQIQAARQDLISAEPHPAA